FHTLFESAVRLVFFQLFRQKLPFELIAFIAISCGTFFPLLLEKKILRQNMLTKKFLLGLS
ncbi:MAG: hypothetical protein NC924_09355, partial [Candidatus Omnitrophica bacterium]|nr:hypothetical protein [Candidatus Omnitrophota bacterium]